MGTAEERLEFLAGMTSQERREALAYLLGRAPDLFDEAAALTIKDRKGEAA